MSAAGFTTNESSQVLLVSVHNIIYPITEYELHLVFDPFGYVEKIDMLQSRELLQAIVQFDSCQNAVWAKSQLQGRYIYDRFCQLDIQFYKSFDNDNQTRIFLMENEFASDLDFIKNELRRIIIIVDRMQDRIKTMNSSIQKITHTSSKSSESTVSISVISPTKPKVCNDSVAVVSTTSEIHIKKGSVNNFETEQKFGRNLGLPGQVLEQLSSKTYLDLLLSYDNNIHTYKSKPMPKLIDLESAHVLFEGMHGLSVIPQHSHIVDVQVCGVLLSEHHPFNFYKEKLDDILHRTSMDDCSKYACKMLDNMCKYGVIVGYMKRDKSNSVLKIHWKVIRVFDPGGVYMALYDQGIYYLVASVKGNYGCVHTGANALNKWDEVVWSYDKVLIHNNLSTYDDVYLSYAVAKYQYADMINKLNLLNFYQPTKWKESDDTLFFMDLVECTKMISERKIIIFDPGGIFHVESIFDFEDKVDFKGSVMIGFGTMLMDNIRQYT